MRQLFKRSNPIRKAGNPIADKAPMVDDGKIIKSSVNVETVTKAQTKKKPDAPKLEKKASRAKTFFTILSTVMLFTFLFSQASTLVSCAKSAIDQVQKTTSAPALAPSNAEALDEESKNNNSLIMPAPNQVNKFGDKPIAPPATSKKLSPDSGMDGKDSRAPSNDSHR